MTTILVILAATVSLCGGSDSAPDLGLCAPATLDLCDDMLYRGVMEKFMQIPQDELAKKIVDVGKEMDEASKQNDTSRTVKVTVGGVELDQTLDEKDFENHKNKLELTKLHLIVAKVVDQWNKDGRKGDPEANNFEGLPFFRTVLFEVQGMPVKGGAFIMGIVVLGYLIGCIWMLYSALPENSALPKLEEKAAGGMQLGQKVWALARHILVATEEEVPKVQARLDAGEDFEEVAAEISICPSGKRCAGTVGPFAPADCNPDFGKICFDSASELNKVYHVKTKNGYHLLRVEARSGLAKLSHADKVRMGLAKEEDAPEIGPEEPEKEEAKKDK